MNALWTETSSIPSFGRLDQNICTDVLIIGGGLAGVLCAYMLGKAGADYALVEAGSLCRGVTSGTTAKLTSQHGLIYHKLIRMFGDETARLYLQANEEALAQYRRLCASMDCAFQEQDNYVYTLNRGDLIQNELTALQKLGFPARRTEGASLPFPVAGAVCFPRQAQFNPLRFVQEIAKGLRIYERTPVRELVGTTALTDRGRVAAQRVIVATHFPFLNKHGAYFLKLYQHRSYGIALENAPPVDGMYVDEAPKGLSFRNANGLLLLGGGDHRTGKKGGCWMELRDFAAKHYPTAKERYHWAAQDCMSLDGVPYIGPYSPGTKNLYVTTGFNKWGMTSAMAGAMLLADLLQGKKNPYQAVFNPARTMLRPGLAANAAEAAVSLLTPTTRRCPHLGCALKWNPAEHSWDCPCHGSRFTQDGALLDNPATGGLKRKKS